MVHNDDYIYSGSQKSKMTYSDFSVSEYSGSTTTPHLRKLVSLDIDPSISGFHGGSSVIDLTQTPSDDLLSTCPAHKFLAGTLDDSTGSRAGEKSLDNTGGAVRGHSSKNSTSTAPSSYIPNKYSADHDLSITTTHLIYHRPAALGDAKSDRKQNLRTYGNVTSKMDTSTQPSKYKNATTTARENTVQNSATVFGSLFHCVNPSVPGEADMPMKWVAHAATMQALRSDEDTLDTVFNTVERFACRDDTEDYDIGRELRDELGRREPVPMHPHAFQKYRNKPTHKEGTVEPTRSKTSGEKNGLKRREDILDAVFEKVEDLVCSDERGWGPHKFVTHQKDTLDTVFEKFETFACNDDFTVASLHSRGMMALNKIPRENGQIPRSNTKRLGLDARYGDMVERFGKNFEGALCTKPIAQCGYEGDILDNVFEQLEQTACRDQPPTNGGYFDTSVYDLDMQNSLLYTPSESREWNDTPSRRDTVIRKPSWGNTKPSKAQRKSASSRDVADMYMQAGTPRQSESHLSGRERAKNSLERIRAIRERYLSKERYCSGEHCY